MTGPSRFRVVLAATTVLLGVSLAACGSSDDDSAGAASGPFTFTDDLGNDIELDEQPQRLLVQSSMAAALTDLGLGDRIVGVFGPLENAKGEPDSQVAGLDVDSVTDVTDAAEYGNIELEDAAALDPDLVVTSSYLDDDLWYINDKTAAQIEKQYPILTVSFDGKTLPEMLDGTERAAEALGADVDSDAVQQAHDDFAAAADRVKAASTALGDKRVLAGSPAQDVFYVSNPEVSPDLTYWRTELGLPLTVPTKPDPGGYFQSLSWEKADQYPADVLLYDDRVGAAGLALFDDQPAFEKLNAYKNKAYVPWTSVAPPSYQAYADLMNRLADDLAKVS